MIRYLSKEYGLKGDNIKYVAKHLTLCRKHNAADRIVVYVDDEEYHTGLQQRLITAYPIQKVTDKSAADKDFVLVPAAGIHAVAIIDDINTTVDSYRQAHPEIVVDDDDSKPDTTPETKDENEQETKDENEQETKTVDWSTYIIIGVAVVAVIVILLWGRNRK